MAGKSLNKVQLIGNLTRDPELKYTPTGAAVCTINIATNRNWVTDTGEKKEDVEFHRLVAWRKLAEICGQYLKKGSKTYVEGRLSTRKWTDKDGVEKYTTEVVVDDIIMLDSKRSEGGDYSAPARPVESEKAKPVQKEAKSAKSEEK